MDIYRQLPHFKDQFSLSIVFAQEQYIKQPVILFQMCINCYNFWLAIPLLFEYKYIYVDFVSHSNYFFLLAKTYAVLGWFQRLYSVFHPQLAMGLLYLYFLYISRDTTYELSFKKKRKTNYYYKGRKRWR